MKDVRRQGLGLMYPNAKDAGPGRAQAAEMSADAALVPDFVCDGCGRGVWGEKEPGRCVKCGGMRFTARTAIDGGAEALAAGLERVRRDLLTLIQMTRKVGRSGIICRYLAEAERRVMKGCRKFYDNERKKRKKDDKVVTAEDAQEKAEFDERLQDEVRVWAAGEAQAGRMVRGREDVADGEGEGSEGDEV